MKRICRMKEHRSTNYCKFLPEYAIYITHISKTLICKYLPKIPTILSYPYLLTILIRYQKFMNIFFNFRTLPHILRRNLTRNTTQHGIVLSEGTSVPMLHMKRATLSTFTWVRWPFCSSRAVNFARPSTKFNYQTNQQNTRQYNNHHRITSIKINQRQRQCEILARIHLFMWNFIV